jgi:hypothetical protein
MKEFIAYALVVIAVPVFVPGFLLAAIVYVPAYLLLFRCSLKVRAFAVQFLEIFTGLGVAVAALVLFRLFKLTPNIAVPVILTVWAFIYFVQYKKLILRWLSWMVGFFIGWFALAKMLLS